MIGVTNFQVTVGKRTGAHRSTCRNLRFLVSLQVMGGWFSCQVTVKSSVSREMQRACGQSPDNLRGFSLQVTTVVPSVSR